MQIDHRAKRPSRRAPKPVHAILAGVLALGASASANADYVFTTIDYPGAVFTDVRGLNNAGAIVGYASLDGTNNFGFLYSGGTFTPLPPAPGGLQVGGHGINDSGVIVGSAIPVDGSSSQGFVLLGSTYTYFSYPGKTHTYARSINAAGVVTGYAEDHDASGNTIAGSNVGFIYDPASGLFTDVVVPGSVLTIAQGINTAGQVTGSARIAGRTWGFLRNPDATLNTFQIDNHFTAVRGINNSGLATGFNYDAASNHMVAFVANSSGRQLLRANDVDETFGEAINDSGQISGLFQHLNPDGSTTPSHGFISTPAALPTGTTVGGAYTFAVDVVPNTPVFIDPPPSLGFDYVTGNGDPEFTTVRLPIGIGDSRYMLIVNNRQYPLAGGELFDFREHGYTAGVSNFRVTDIETSAGLDPKNPLAFPTQLAFSRAGRFTGSMTPLCLKHALPPQASAQARRSLLQSCQ